MSLQKVGEILKQESLFGRAVDLSIMKYEKRGKKTIKQAFREVAGYDVMHRCDDCKYHYSYERCNKRIHKCRKIGDSGSKATDIRLSDRACKFYESEGSEKNGKK